MSEPKFTDAPWPSARRSVTDDCPVDRRRHEDIGATTPMDIVRGMPALLVLERFPVPVLAVGHDGVILFANGAFAAMVGRPRESLSSAHFSQIFRELPTEESAVAVAADHAGSVVKLAHADGWIIQARMSASALLRGDDPVALVAFDDLTEQLWSDARHRT